MYLSYRQKEEGSLSPVGNVILRKLGYYLVLAVALAIVELVVRLLYQMFYGVAGDRFSGTKSHGDFYITGFAFAYVFLNGLAYLFDCEQAAFQGIIHHDEYFFTTPAAYHIL